MATVRSLSDSDVAAVREELSGGGKPMVWFTSAAVGMVTGGSAKVVSVGEVTEGEFLEVRPAGSRDTMFCSAGELTRDRPARKRVPRSPVAEPVTPETTRPAPGPTPVAAALRPVAAGGAPVDVPVPVPVAGPVRVPVPAPAPVSEVRRNGQRRPASAEVVVTLHGSAEGDWTVEVVVGKKRVVRTAPVQPAEVARASRALPAPVAEAIEASLAAARTRQAERVEHLRAELEAARQALRDLAE